MPWLPRVTDLKRLRRQIRRTRAGVIAPSEARIPASAWADTLEQAVVMNVMEMREQKQQDEERAQLAAEEEQRVRDYNGWSMEIYRMFKRLPEANDPNSEIAIQVEAMKRELRAARGRPRKRRKRRSGADG